MPHFSSEIIDEHSEGNETSQDVIVPSGEFYMNLDEFLLKTKASDNLSTFRILYKGKIVGVLQDPRTEDLTTGRISLEEFRDYYHGCLECFSNEDAGITITVNGEPAGYFSSRSRYLRELGESKDFLIGYLKKQERQAKKTRSFISRLFNRKSG